MKVIEKSIQIGSFSETGVLSEEMILDLQTIIQNSLNNSYCNIYNIEIDIDEKCILRVSTPRYLREIYSIINYNSPVMWGMTTTYEGSYCHDKFWLYKAHVIFHLRNENRVTYSYNMNKKRFSLHRIESNSYSSKASCVLVSSNIEKIEYRKG